MALQFTYQFRPFGTPFSGGDALKDGEIATDVGGGCLAYNGEQSLIIDHHFHRPNNFPSASTAVLHLAPTILNRLQAFEQIKLITHQKPDFDALCSLYLVRRILEGGIPADGWGEFGLCETAWSVPNSSSWKIDWFSPRLEKLGIRRAAILLAAYASTVDQCKPLHCDRTTALHSILYAGAKRGRDWEADGAYEFFRAAEERIQQGHNPLFDTLFDERSEYAPELAMLSREEGLYQRDIARARITVVNLPFHNGSFSDWYSPIALQPLLTAPPNPELDSLHLCNAHSRRQGDGLFLRDPECILFKEWARTDNENSPSGRGFIFTAIAYSTSIAAAASNKSRYIFSVDPEMANGAHLYPVWARLQAAECAKSTALSNAARSGFEGRLTGTRGADDPWFDGHNFKATIIDTPRGGTQLKAGVLADLSDDEAAQLVRQELEWTFFVPEKALPNPQFAHRPEEVVCILDFPTCGDADLTSSSPISTGIEGLVPLPNANKALRFASVGLPNHVETSSPIVAESIGKTLWAAIADEGVITFPTDFQERHLWFDSNSVTVWNRHGIAIASKEIATIKSQKKALQQIAGILRDAAVIAKSANPGSAFKKGRELLESVIHLQIIATDPRNIILRRLMQAIEIQFIVESVTAINRERFEANEQAAQERRDMRLQAILAVGTAIGLLISWNQMESVSFRALHVWLGSLFPMLGSIQPEAGPVVFGKFLVGILLAFFFGWLFLKNTGASKK